MLNKRDHNIEQDNHDYNFCHNQAALIDAYSNVFGISFRLIHN